jgi:DNA mismatch repair ATPase MutS
MLLKLEKMHNTKKTSQLSLQEFITDEQKEHLVEKKCEIEEKINSLDLNNLTPLQALNFLNELKK